MDGLKGCGHSGGSQLLHCVTVWKLVCRATAATVGRTARPMGSTKNFRSFS